MNEPAEVTERADGYVQDRGVAAGSPRRSAPAPGERVVDLCAAPGGKATGLAGAGAARRRRRRRGRPGRPRRRERRAASALPVRVRRSWPTAGARPCGPASADRVLVDAPCSGLGALRRRPDARWRIDADAVDRLAGLQRELLDGAADARRARRHARLQRLHAHRGPSRSTSPTASPTAHPGFDAARPAGRAVACRGGAAPLLLPQAAGTDGMAVFRWTAALVRVRPVAGEGDRGVRRRGRRQPSRPRRSGGGRARWPRPGSRSSPPVVVADGVESVARRAARPGRRVHRAGRHDRRHRLRAPRPHARGHPGRARPGGPRPGRGHAPGQPARPPVPRHRRHHRHRPRPQPAGLARRAPSSASTPSSTSSPTPSTSSPATAPTDRTAFPFSACGFGRPGDQIRTQKRGGGGAGRRAWCDGGHLAETCTSAVHFGPQLRANRPLAGCG